MQTFEIIVHRGWHENLLGKFVSVCVCVFDIGLDSDLIDFCWAQTQLLWFNISAFESRVRPAESMDAFSSPLGNLLAVVMQVLLQFLVEKQ